MKQEEKKFDLEYEVFPMRAIWKATVEAVNEEQALQKFWDEKPYGIVRKINGINKSPYLRKSP